jgi:hypothetical protein
MRTLRTQLRWLSLTGFAAAAGSMLLVISITAGRTAPQAPEDRRPQPGSSVLRWSRLATEIFSAEIGPLIDARGMAILHAAIHDAVNGIDRRYEPYTTDLSSPGASVDAAIVSAAHDVMIALVPSQRARIEKEYSEALAADMPYGPARDAGVSLGQQAARANLDRRSDDGIVPGPWPPRAGPITEPIYVPAGTPGDYDFTPPFDAPPLGPIALFPGLGRLKPFVIELARHRLGGPDPLRSHRYARDLAFVKSVGSMQSTTRTADQTTTAFFWYEPFAIWNEITQNVIRQHSLDEWDAARALTLVNFAIMDGGVACFEAKYHFRFWRPYTAIRRAGDDDNEATEPDPTWLPLLWSAPDQMPPTFVIPPIPDYPSAAAVTSAAAAEVLRALFGDRDRISATSDTLPGVTRHFTSFRQAATEAGMSRVYGGIHFLHAVEDGFMQGRSIGRVVSGALPRSRR